MSIQNHTPVLSFAMIGRLSTNEKKRLGRQTLNERLGQNLKTSKTGQTGKNLRRGLAGVLLLAAFVVLIAAFLGH